MAIKDTGERFKAHYDKLIAFVVMVTLLGSLAYLAVQVGLMKKEQAQFAQRIKSKSPQNPHAEVMSPSPYEKTLGEIRRPFQILISTNSMLFVPEKRFYCFACFKPVEFGVTNKCTWCGEGPQEPVGVVKKDIDGDGMPNVWEKEHGFNIHAPADGELDADGDKFTNLQECEAGTNPRDDNEFPPLVVLLEVESIRRVPFRMLFQGKSELPDGTYKYQINYGGKTSFVRLGQKVGREPDEGIEDTRFTLEAYRERFEVDERRSQTLGREIKVDVSEVDLVRDRKKFTLVFQKQKIEYERYATLVLRIDDLRFENLEVDRTIELRDGAYKVKAIDSEEETVVLTREGDEEETFTITKGGKKPATGE